MTRRPGDLTHTLLDDLHAPGCEEDLVSKCQALTVERFEGNPPARQEAIEVVWMEWCDECGAADYEVV